MSRQAWKLWLGLSLALAATTGGLLGTTAQADGPPDWDGDGAVAGDCGPLDRSVHPGATDLPDLAFEDVNCDGMDGDPDDAYFVQPNGSDGNVGTSNAPFQTIQKAVSMAAASATKKAIYVATGNYGRATLPTTADGVRIYGGYAASTWARTTATATAISGEPDALLLDGARDVVVQLVELRGARGTGLSAYGLRAINGSEVALIRSKAIAGAGGPGTAGNPGSTPPAAANGDSGDTGPNCDNPGAGGFFTQPGNGTDGGPGGTGGQETNDGENGVAGTKGSGTGGGSPGSGGIDIAGDAHGANDGMHGQPGGPGATGNPGSAGSGGQNGLTGAGATWTGQSGGDGANGDAGFGGGGGGGGAGRGGSFDWGAGAGGGQGGDGGSGGTRGSGGTWGGGSFGVYLSGSDAAVTDGSSLTAAAGGAGGAGGTGGPGGSGGSGGPGGAARSDCGLTVSHGGDGGSGGPGGKGGDGGGGSGGPSAALMRIGASNATDRNSTLAGGSGGSGGTGGGATGQAGQRIPASGSAATDFDGDGITDASDACVDVQRGTDGNGDGCPDRAALADGDGDGVPNDGRDACPSQAAGTDADHNGCTDGTGGDPGAGPPGGSTPPGGNTGDGTATTGGGTPGGPTTPVGPAPPFNPRVSSGWDPAGRNAVRFYKLTVAGLPKGAKVAMACTGKRCAFKRKSVAVKGTKLNVLKAVGRLRLRGGQTLQLKATGPAGQLKVVTWGFAKGKRVRTTYRCAAPGAKLRACD